MISAEVGLIMGIKIFGYEVCPLDIVTGDNRRLATTKIWTNVAYAQMTYIMYWLRPDKVSWEYVALFLAYGAVVGGSFVAQKFFEMKFAGPQPDTTINQPEKVNVTGNVIVKSGKKK